MNYFTEEPNDFTNEFSLVKNLFERTFEKIMEVV